MKVGDYERTKPHCESCRPYGYRFESIDLITPETWSDAMIAFDELEDSCNQHSIQIGNKNKKHVERIIWEVARHIEGNYGTPYDAVLVYSHEHSGTLFVFTPKIHDWWKPRIRSLLSDYLMGLRALLDLLK